jgi:hypothetical protein
MLAMLQNASKILVSASKNYFTSKLLRVWSDFIFINGAIMGF